MDTIGIKPAHGDDEYNFKKVGAIPCGGNTNGTLVLLYKNVVCLRHYRAVMHKIWDTNFGFGEIEIFARGLLSPGSWVLVDA